MWDRFGITNLQYLALFDKNNYLLLPLINGHARLFYPRKKSICNLGVQLALFQPGGQIMPTTLLLAHPDLTRDTIRNYYEYEFYLYVNYSCECP